MIGHGRSRARPAGSRAFDIVRNCRGVRIDAHPHRGHPFMWIVRLALSRPYTFVVMAILIAILGGSAITTMPVDIFPFIDIPVVSVLWVYSGLSPEEMEKRVVTNFERSLTSNVNDVEHIESQSYSGYAVVKVYFHPNVKVDMAVAQITATMNTALRQMP